MRGVRAVFYYEKVKLCAQGGCPHHLEPPVGITAKYQGLRADREVGTPGSSDGSWRRGYPDILSYKLTPTRSVPWPRRGARESGPRVGFQPGLHPFS